PAPLRPAGAASGGQFVIVLRLDGTEDDRVVAAELLALRRAHPGHHVGLWLTDTAVPLSARRALPKPCPQVQALLRPITRGRPEHRRPGRPLARLVRSACDQPVSERGPET